MLILGNTETGFADFVQKKLRLRSPETDTRRRETFSYVTIEQKKRMVIYFQTLPSSNFSFIFKLFIFKLYFPLIFPLIFRKIFHISHPKKNNVNLKKALKNKIAKLVKTKLRSIIIALQKQ